MNNDITVVDCGRTNPAVLYHYDHVHDLVSGVCVRNRYGPKCQPKQTWYGKFIDRALDFVERYL